MDPITILFLVFFNGAIVLAMVMAGINIAISDRLGIYDDHWKECEAYIEDISLLVDQYCNDNKRDGKVIEQRMHKIFSKMQRRMQYLDKWQCREIHDLRDELMNFSAKSHIKDEGMLAIVE